ncbi:MAG TPA: AAA family ATPase [Chthoniobacterales bacterium]|nr:AAA family ATPase [Chthoniobacterales bacterium]
MTPEERASLQTENVKGTRSQHLLEPALAKALAVSHLFERSSIARELHAAGMLLRRGIGRVSVDQAKAFAFQDPRFVRPDPGARIVTTREVLHEESEMLKGVDAGRGRYEEIGRDGSWNPVSQISDEQRAAVEHILRSRDLVTAIRGVAGTGKTTMMKEAVLAMAALSGKEVLLFAPSSAATQVLKEQGFTAGDTVQSLMTNTIVQDAARGKFLLVDEAGFLSAKQMRWLVKFAGDSQCRLVLCGDSRQHHAVERGDSLRVLEKTGALEPAALTKIFRQKVPALRDAIQELARGNTEKGFDKLDEFGAIEEVEDQAKRLEAIAQRYVAAIKEKKSSLVVAPTHGECRQIAKAVRQVMREQGLLASAEQTFSRLEKLNLTVSQRRDSINYEAGNVIEFHRRAAGGFKSGEQWQVVERAGASELVVENGGRRKALSLSQAGKFSVFKAETISLSVGDRVHITKNFQSRGKKFRNNELHTVTGLRDGKLVFAESEIALKGALHIDQGVAITSHAAQGKTVDQVIVSVPTESFSHANEAQFYVSMSRARESMHLFTDSKIALREAVTRPSSRMSAFELVTDQTAIDRLHSASRYLRGRAPGQPQPQQARQTQETIHER